MPISSMSRIGLKGLGKSVTVISPHDDDGIIGCGGILNDLSLAGARIHVLIMTDGSLGYSTVEQKRTIKETRHREAVSAYGMLRAEPIFLDFPDMNLKSFATWETWDGKDGAYKRVLKILRELKPETVFIPNPSDWHPDHKASFDIGLSISNLARVPAAADFGEPISLRHLFSYKVWDELDRITHAHALSQAAERAKKTAISEFKSQQNVLGIVDMQFRKEFFRKLR